MANTDTTQSTSSRLPAQLVCTTLMGAKINVAQITKQQVVVDKNTTLNELYSVMADTSNGTKNGDDFQLMYYGIGVKGSQYQGTNSSGIPKMIVNQHQPTDGAPFFQIPFIVRELSNDLSTANRAKYRMRVVKPINGVKYAIYYLKLVSFTSFTPSLRLITVDAAGNEVPEVYVPQDKDLHPVPITPNADGTVPLSNQFAQASGRLDLSLTATDLAEIKNACLIVYGDSSMAAINEFAIVTGIDTVNNNGDIGGTSPIRYAEVQSAVCQYMFTETWPRDANANGSIPLFFDIGSSLPMLLSSSN